MDIQGVQYFYIIYSFVMGFTFAFAELLSRYKNALQIFKYLSSNMYMIINGISAIFAYIILYQFNIPEKNDLLRVILAGTSSMLILRSSFANIRIGDKEIKAGIAEIIQIFLEYAEKTFNLKRSKEDALEISEIMSNVDFEKAKTALPYTCFNLMNSISDKEETMVQDAIIEQQESNHSNSAKSLNLGIRLARVTKLEFLKTAVDILGDDIKENVEHIDEIDKLLERLK